MPELGDVVERVRQDIVIETVGYMAHTLAARVRDRAVKVGLERAASAEDLVRKETLSPTGPGQPLGDLGTGIALDTVAFSLPEGEISDPVRAADGWGVMRVLERTGFDTEAFAQEKPRVVASLRQQKQGEAFQAYIGAARERYEIQQNPEAYRRALGRE